MAKKPDVSSHMEKAQAAAERGDEQKLADERAAMIVESTMPEAVQDAIDADEEVMEYVVSHTLVTLGDGTSRSMGEMVTSAEVRGAGSKAEQDAREKRLVDAGAIQLTKVIKTVKVVAKAPVNKADDLAGNEASRLAVPVDATKK